jgi:uncharacterized protein
MTDSTLRGFIQRHPLSTFFGLTFLFSWLWWGALFVIAPDGMGSADSASPLLFLYALWGAPLVGPALVSLGLSAILGGMEGPRALLGRLTQWRAGIPWYFAALLTTPLIVLAALGFLAATVSPRFIPGVPSASMMLLMIIVGGGVSSLLEELGWTGFAVPRLLARHRALTAGLLLGLFWALWHIPINIWAQSPRFDSIALATYLLGSGTAFLTLVAYRVLIAWVYVNSKGSLLLGWVMHWSHIVGLSLLLPSPSALEVLQIYAVFTVGLWIAVGLVVARFGASTLSRASGRRPSAAADFTWHVQGHRNAA